MRISLIAFLLLCFWSATAAEIPDGLWNGKPWDAQELQKKLETRDPHALAEKAYWMRYAWLNSSPNPDEEFKLLSEAHEKGSPMATAMLARCYLVGRGVQENQKKGGELVRKAVELGHPLGLKNLANCYLSAQGEYPKNIKKSHQFQAEAIAKKCITAEENLLLNLYQGTSGFKRDRKRSIQIAAKILRDQRHGLTAAKFTLKALSENQNLKPFKDPKLLKLALDRVQMASDLGEGGATVYLAKYLINTGRPNEGVPYLLKSARQSSSSGLYSLLSISTGGYLARKAHVIGQYSTQYQLARDAFSAGSNSSFTIKKVAESYLYTWCEEKPNPAKALPHLQQLLKQNYKGAHHLLGTVYLKYDHAQHDPKRGEAHHIYSLAREGSWILQLLLEEWGHTPGDTKDLAKAVAAGTQALKYITHPTRVGKVTRRLKETLLKLTPEDKKRAEDLIERNYPISEEFVKKAVETLIEYGDLPEGTKVPKVSF